MTPDPTKPTRKRRRKVTRAGARPVDVDPHQLEVDDGAEELLALWRVMPAALARDSAGTLNGDRHATGAKSGSDATINVAVVDAAARIETGLYELAAEAVRMLNLDRDIAAAPQRIIAALPEWHRSLTGRSQPLAGHIRKDLRSWLADARGAIGTRRFDERLGSLCPDHRAEHPTELRIVGATARLAPSLLAGPPADARLLPSTTAVCADPECAHSSCRHRRERRLVDRRGVPTDWVLDSDGSPRWSSAEDGHPFEWERSGTIRCPRCKKSWTSVTERRILARQLVALGDVPSHVAALVG